MKNLIYVFSITLLLFNCSSEDDTNDSNNLAPGPFSVTILETRMDGATIEWTESIDIDSEDIITYSLYLNDEPISIGGITLSYNFTGLEPETSYDGYIIAEDSNGGTSQANFFFVTEPEVTIQTLEATYWLIDSFPEGEGTRNIWGMGFFIPFEDDATSYQLEVNEIVYETGFPFYEGSVFNWNNDSPNSTYISYDSASNGYRVALLSTSINTLSSNYDEYFELVTNVSGDAELIITFGDN